MKDKYEIRATGTAWHGGEGHYYVLIGGKTVHTEDKGVDLGWSYGDKMTIDEHVGYFDTLKKAKDFCKKTDLCL